MQRQAARMGLTPRQFWDLTPREFHLWVEGWAEKQRDEMRRSAWEVSHMMAAWTGKWLHPAQLLGESEPEGPRTAATMDEFKAMMREAKRREEYGDL